MRRFEPVRNARIGQVAAAVVARFLWEPRAAGAAREAREHTG